MFTRIFSMTLLLLLPFSGFSKPKPVADKELAHYEDSLKKIGPAMFHGSDPEKFSVNQKFLNVLRKAMTFEGAFDFPFDSLKFIANLKAPDNSFRIFNWNIPKDDGTFMYYGFVFVDDAKVGTAKKGAKDHYTVYELTDKSNDIRGPEQATLSPEKWFGALYYKIILTNDKDKKYYTLLGWDGNNPQTWKKIIDVISFGKDGKPVFGEKNLFQRGRKSTRRVIFEYRAELIMALQYEEDNKRIIFDHLAPDVAGADGMYQFYGADGSYDGFIWKKGKWQLAEDLDVRLPGDKKDKQYINPQGDRNPDGTPATNPNKPHSKLYYFFHPKKKPQQPGRR